MTMPSPSEAVAERVRKSAHEYATRCRRLGATATLTPLHPARRGSDLCREESGCRHVDLDERLADDV